jgi:hypothetical protein
MRNAFVTGYPVSKLAKLEDGDVIIEGKAATNHRDVQGDMISKGMLRKIADSLNSGRPLYLNHYYHTPPIGQVLKARYMEDEDEAYVWVRAVIDTNDSEIKRNAAAGRMPYFSIGGHLLDYKMNKAGGKETRECLDGNILELSITPAPINIMAGYTIAKGSIIDLQHNLAMFKSIIENYDSENYNKINIDSIEFKDVEFVKSEESNMEGKSGKATGFTDVKEKTHRDTPVFGENGGTPGVTGELPSLGNGFNGQTKFAEENTDKFVKPSTRGDSRVVDPLNYTANKEVFEGHDSKAIPTGEDYNDFGGNSEGNGLDPHSNSWIGSQNSATSSVTNPSSGASPEPGNATDKTGSTWLEKHHSDYEGMKKSIMTWDKAHKAALVDALLHDFGSTNIYQEDYESDIEAMHRLIELGQSPKRFRKGGRQREMLESEIIQIAKATDFTQVERSLYDRMFIGHLMGMHLGDFEKYLKAAGYEDEESDPMAESAESAPPSPQVESGAPPAQEMPPEASAGGGQADEFQQLVESDPEFQQAVIAILQKYGLVDESGQPIQGSNPDAEEQATEEIKQLFEQYNGQDEQPAPSGPVPSMAKSMTDMDIRKAARDAFDEAQAQGILRSRTIPEEQQYPTVKGEPISPSQMALAQFIKHNAYGNR